MTTYYTIHAYDQMEADGEDLIDNHKLYTTFDKAADAIEGHIQAFIERINKRHQDKLEKPITFKKPDREWNAETITLQDYLHYYTIYEIGELLFVISKMTVDTD